MRRDLPSRPALADDSAQKAALERGAVHAFDGARLATETARLANDAALVGDSGIEASRLVASLHVERRPQVLIAFTIKPSLDPRAKIPCKIRRNLSFGQRIAQFVTIPNSPGGCRNPRIRHFARRRMKILRVDSHVGDAAFIARGARRTCSADVLEGAEVRS